MERKVKMIWDFRGQGAQHTAEHHKIHLEEYALAERLAYDLAGVEQFGEFHSIAFMVVDESKLPALRETLKPHRGQWYTDH